MYNIPLIKPEDVEKKIKKRNIWMGLFILIGLLGMINFILKKQYILIIIPILWIIAVYLYVKRVNAIYKTKTDNYMNVYQNGRLVKNCPVVHGLPKDGITFFTPHIQYKRKDGTIEYLDSGGFKCLNGCVADRMSIYPEPSGEKNDIVIDESTGFFYYDKCIDRTSGNKEEDFYQSEEDKKEETKS